LMKLASGSDFDLTLTNISWLLIKEAVGGLILGFGLGFLASKAMRDVDDYKVSVLITMAVVMGGYLVAHSIHISGPLTMVAAGLVIGNYGKRTAMSTVTKDYLGKFWELVDEIMNAILFLFIGFELLLIPEIMLYWKVGAIAVLVVLMARYLAIWIPTKIIPFKKKFDRNTIRILTWGGLRGGVSIALAISVSSRDYADIIIATTYFVVIFSILAQGLTIGKLANRLLPKTD
jgi:CPA1 family monovalent cation:H+ antiporter